jgi:hypothetical protein
MITGYDSIPAFTTLKFLIGGIETLREGLKAEIKVAIQYNLIEEGVDSYYLTPIDFPIADDEPTVSPTAVTVSVGTLDVTGSSQVKESATYTFTYTLNGNS